MGLTWTKKPKNKFVKPKTVKKKIKIDEFGKWIVFSAFILLCVWVTASYFLAWFSKDSNSEVTVALIVYCLTSILGYFVSNSFSKNSRNKYNIDANGIPHNINTAIDSISIEHEDGR